MTLLEAVAHSFELLLTGAAFCVLVWCLVSLIGDSIANLREVKRARVEAELDEQSERLRRTILTLAEELAAERDEASKALTRAMFLAEGRIDHHRQTQRQMSDT